MKFLIHIFLLFSCCFCFAQQKSSVTLSGKVTDFTSQQPLEYATIVLENTKTQKISGGITAENGAFSIESVAGIYNISIEFIGYQAHKLENFKLDKNTKLGVIQLTESSNELDEIELIAEKTTVELKLDKRIYNVGKDMTVKGGTVADVLDNVPSVAVDVEGNVSLRGNENVRILINGKPSGLVGLSSTEALRQFPADAIEKIEVITSPSARYDAEGTAGILNIILRKGKINGTNGSITTTLGYPELYGISGNANYRTNTINLFTNAGYINRSGPGNSSVDLKYLDDTGEVVSTRSESVKYDRNNEGININVGTEVFLNKKSTLTGSVLLRNSDGDDTVTNYINETDETNNSSSNSLIENELEEDNTVEYNINYLTNFNDKGHKLSVDVQSSFNKENESSLTRNEEDSFNPIIRTSTREKKDSYLVQSDYNYPINDKSQLELGFRFNLDDTNTRYLVEDYSETDGFIQNNDFTNELNFKQDVYAFYIQYGNKIKDKFSYLLGLRTELTYMDIHLINTNEVFDKKFSQLFPTLNLGYELSDNESITFGYSRRLRRPRHWFLNPFRSFSSQTNYFVGNVDLDPTFTNSFDLGYLKKWNKLTFNSSVYHQHTINSLEFVSEESGDFFEGTPIIRRTPINLSSEDRYGLEFTGNLNASKKIRLSGSFNFFYFKKIGVYSYINSSDEEITQDFGAESTSWFARFNSKVTLPGKIDWQTRIFYRGAQRNAQSDRQGIFSTNLAFSKDLFKDKATLVLNVNDLFNSRKRRSTNYTANTIAENEFQWRERQINLNFTYRFNQKKKRNRNQNNYSNDNDGGGF